MSEDLLREFLREKIKSMLMSKASKDFRSYVLGPCVYELNGAKKDDRLHYIFVAKNQKSYESIVSERFLSELKKSANRLGLMVENVAFNPKDIITNSQGQPEGGEWNDETVSALLNLSSRENNLLIFILETNDDDPNVIVNKMNVLASDLGSEVIDISKSMKQNPYR